MPTISGMRRRGITPTAIRQFCEKAGIAKREKINEFSLLKINDIIPYDIKGINIGNIEGIIISFIDSFVNNSITLS